MTELQMGLIGLGAAAVAGVLGYNKWQEYRHRKVAEAVLQPHPDDLLFAEAGKRKDQEPVVERSEPEIRVDDVPPVVVERIEPVFADPDEPAVTIPEIEEAVPELVAVVEESPVPAPPVEEAAPAVAAGLPPSELIDPRLEYIVTMELVESANALDILQSQREALRRLSKPVHWVGFNDSTREWQRLTTDSDLRVRRLRIGMQLVNRLGPASEADLTIFTNAMRALADELMAVADMPSTRVLDQAAEIDRFCAAVDLEIGLNLVSRGTAFSGTKIRALAEAAGMVLGIDGLFTRYDDDGCAQFSLQNYESTQFSPDSIRTLTTHGLTFLLDVPRVDHGERVFMQMTELAKRFGETLNGALVDDNRQPLSDAQLEHIRREFIGKPQATMASYGLPAGSPQARRLFS